MLGFSHVCLTPRRLAATPSPVPARGTPNEPPTARWVESSNLYINYSIIEVKDALVHVANSTASINNATWYVAVRPRARLHE